MINSKFLSVSLLSLFILTACSSGNLTDTKANFVQQIGFFVDTTKCKTSPLPAKEFTVNCTYLAESPLTSNVTVRAVQNVPTNYNADQKVNIGESIHLEFYENGKRLGIPDQIFHTFWTTDYLGLFVSYVDDDHIYVQGTFPTSSPLPEYKYSYLNGKAYDNVYTYLYHGGKWTELFPQTIVQDNSRLQLFASDKFLKLINSRDCIYDSESDNFYSNNKNGTLVGTKYILDAYSYQLISKEDKNCIAS